MGKENRSYFYHDWFGYLDLLTYERGIKLMKAIGDFMVDNDETEFKDDEVLQKLYSRMIKQVKSDKAAYDDKCAVNRANGAKGGRPPKESKENPSKREQSEQENEFMKGFNARYNCDQSS